MLIVLLGCAHTITIKSAEKQFSATKLDIVAILKGVQDFVQNYSIPPSLVSAQWNIIRPKVNYQSAPIISIQMALIQIPYRIFGITAAEVNQFTQGGIPAGIGTKIHNNSAAAFELLKKLPVIFEDLPNFILDVCRYMKLAINPKNMPPELRTAVDTIEETTKAKRNFISDFGLKFAAVMQDLKIALILQNLSAYKQTVSITDRHIMYELSQASNKIKPEFESLTSTLGSVEPDFIDTVFDALKKINYKKLNYQAIEQDIQAFNIESRQLFAHAQ